MEALVACQDGQVGLDLGHLTAGSVINWSKCFMTMALVSTGNPERGQSMRPAWKRRKNGGWA